MRKCMLQIQFKGDTVPCIQQELSKEQYEAIIDILTK